MVSQSAGVNVWSATLGPIIGVALLVVMLVWVTALLLALAVGHARTLLVRTARAWSVAPPEGFEPPTPALGRRRSIH
jgi:hypothetical protein